MGEEKEKMYVLLWVTEDNIVWGHRPITETALRELRATGEIMVDGHIRKIERWVLCEIAEYSDNEHNFFKGYTTKHKYLDERKMSECDLYDQWQKNYRELFEDSERVRHQLMEEKEKTQAAIEQGQSLDHCLSVIMKRFIEIKKEFNQ